MKSLKKEFGNTKQKLNQDFIEKFSSLDKKITENKEKYEKDLGSLNKELRKEIEGISKEFSKSLEEKTSALNLKMNNKIEEVRRHVDFAINRQEKLRKEVLKEISSVTATISTNVIVSLKSINNVFDVLKKFNFQEINTVITNAVNVLNRSIKEIDDLDGHADGLVVVNKENLFNRMEAEIEKSEAFNLKEAAGEKK